MKFGLNSVLVFAAVMDAIILYFVLFKKGKSKGKSTSTIRYPVPKSVALIPVPESVALIQAEQPSVQKSGDQSILQPTTIIKYEGKHSNISMQLSPGYQYFPLPDEIKEKVENEQNERQQILRSNCPRSGTGRRANHLTHNILVDDQHKFIMCYITKIASTSWRVKLAAANSTHIPDYYMIRRNFSRTMKQFGIRKLMGYSRPEIEKRLKTYYKFVFVRHPLERMLSAYRHLFEERQDNKVTVQRFMRFANHIKKLVRRNKPQRDPVKFEEYVRYTMTRGRSNNEHWTTYTSMCNFCQVKYNFIGKFETLPEDISYLLRKIYTKEENYWFPATSAPRSAASYTKQYYSQLPSSLIYKVKDHYKGDFTLFNYTVDEYVQHSDA